MTVKINVTYYKSTRIIKQFDPDTEPLKPVGPEPVYRLNGHIPKITNYSSKQTAPPTANLEPKRFSRSKLN